MLLASRAEANLDGQRSLEVVSKVEKEDLKSGTKGPLEIACEMCSLHSEMILALAARAEELSEVADCGERAVEQEGCYWLTGSHTICFKSIMASSSIFGSKNR